tara:strand:- start:20466 stop:21071 length:606 start_codon:yes stop_codon:yes gene_type:complete
MNIGIINSGICNLFSLENALSHLDVTYITSSNIEELDKCSKLILPGVGAFDAGMNNLKKLDLDLFIQKKVSEGTNLLGICLGMQLLFSSSEEGDLPGLSLIDGNVVKFPDTIKKVPHIGWNDLSYKNEDIDILSQNNATDSFYFIHSYYVDCKTSINCCSTIHENLEFPSIVQSKNIYATQFHPEKSQDAGLKILRNFANL